MSISTSSKSKSTSTNECSFDIRCETSADTETVKSLTMKVFGPGMYARAAYALREGVEAEKHLSFIACKADKIIGSVRLTKINWGNDTVLMLGPLGVLPEHKSLGAGKALMRKAVDAAREHVSKGGPNAIILVGDYAYYQPFGFERIPPEKIQLPRPADPQRILVCDLVEGASAHYSGAAKRMGSG